MVNEPISSVRATEGLPYNLLAFIQYRTVIPSLLENVNFSMKYLILCKVYTDEVYPLKLVGYLLVQGGGGGGGGQAMV